MLLTLTRGISTSLLSCLAGIFLLVTPGRAFDSGLTETEGAIRTWRSEQGLPSDSVSAIIQTRDGFLWIGTSAGLVRFDGVKFTAVNLSGAAATNAPVHVTALCEDSRGYLWIGTQADGLFKLAAGAVTQYTKARGLLDDNVTSLAAGSDGYVWIGTRSGLNLAAGDEMKSFTRRDGLTDDLVQSLHVARSGTVWITTRGGMCRYIDGHIARYELQTESQGRSPEYLGAYEDRRGNLWAYGDTYLVNLTEGKRFNYFRGNEASSVRIWSLGEGRDGRLWIGTSRRGLFCFDDDRFQPVILGELRAPYEVRAICEDHEGNLWLGTTGGGLVQLRPQPVHVMRPGQDLPGAPTALALDAGGRVHVGMQRGGLFVGNAGRFEPFGSANGLEIQDFISSVGVARDGTVWAGTLGGGLYGLRSGRGVHYTTANGLTDDAVLSVCVDREGSVWASTAAGTVHRFTVTNTTRFDATHGLPDVPVTVLMPAIGGGIWLGAEDGSVWREEKGKFFPAQTGATMGHRAVLALHEGEAEQLWIGTAGGLTWWRQGRSVSWNVAGGLPSDYVAGIVTDTASNLWLATGAGIYRISHGAMQKSLADSQTPLVCQQMSDARTAAESPTVFGGNRALFSAEGKLWFATSEGVLNVDTRRPEIESAPLPLYLESVSFNGGESRSLLPSAAWAPVVKNGTMGIAPGDLRSLEIQFTALSFTAPEKTRFRHKLEGADTDWVEDGTTRFAKYNRLAYGRYRFYLAARQADGPWQAAPTTFAFEVPTPLYLQPWALALYGLAAIALVTGIVRVVSHRRLRFALAQLEQQQSLERERMRIARDMHDEIGSKLTKISFLSEHARMDAKSNGPLAGKIQAIAESSRELLQTMDEIVWVVNPRNDNLEHLAAYLSHYAEEYFQNTTVECELRLPQAIAHFPLSSETRHNLFLAFEETLNNVLKHAGASRVKVEMILNAPKFGIVVTDNGCGFDTAAAAGNSQSQGPRGARVGNGLKNLRQRLGDIGGECEIRSQTGAGTTVSLFIRLPRNSNT